MIVPELARIAITNVVSTANLGQEVSLSKFNGFSWGRFDIEDNYNGKVGYVKDTKMQGRVSVFDNGKMISTGAKSVSESIKQLERAMYLLVRNSFVKRAKLEPKVRNVVATADIGSRLDIKRIADSIPRCIFEPEQFPGVIHKPKDGLSCLIFASGKLVIAGARSEQELADFAATLAKQISQLKLTQ